MIQFDLELQEQGDWFPFFDSRFDTSTGEIIYDSPEEEGAEFRIRSMVPFMDERRKLRKKESRMVNNPTTRSMERVTYYADLSAEEEQKESDDAWDYAITGIRNALGADGKPIECTRENKLKLVKIPKFQRFVSRVFQILSGEAARLKERETEAKKEEAENLANG